MVESDFNANGIPGVVVVGPVWFEGFENFPGSKWTFQVNLRGTLENALSEAHLAVEHIGQDLVSFEIGNEPDIAVLVKELTEYNLTQYINEWNTFADAISEQVLKENKYGLDSWQMFQALTFAGHKKSSSWTV